MDFFIVPTPTGFEVWLRNADNALLYLHGFATITEAEAFAEYRRTLLARELQIPIPTLTPNPWRRTVDPPSD